MNGEARRDEIVRMLTESSSPLAGVTLAKHFDVSRQVIVQDIALLRANGFDIFSTNRGYLMQGQTQPVYLKCIMQMKMWRRNLPPL